MKHNTALVVLSALALVATTSLVDAGPLTPSAGPVTATHKTLTEVEPRIAINATNTPGDANSFYRITQPGSYYLTGNVSVGTIEHGIQIDLNTEGLVTIDLNGFSVTGAEGTLNGIDVDGPFKPRVVLRNGFVMAFGGNGVDLVGAEHATVEKVESARNQGRGFIIDTGSFSDCKAQFNSGGGFLCAANSRISNCVALTTGPVGFKSGEHSIIENCTARDTTSHGFDCAANSVLTNCTAQSCNGYGILTGANASLTNCTATSNGEAGIGTNAGSSVIGCTAAENVKWGFSGSNMSVYQNCTARNNNFHGFSASNSTFRECTAAGNALSGFNVGDNSVVSMCTATVNAANGFSAGGRCLIADSDANFNTIIGFSFTGDINVIRGNIAEFNGTGGNPGAGIHVAGSSNRVEDNRCSTNGYGIRVLGTRNVIVRNTCSDNLTANWSIAANNSYGPIIDRSAAVTPAVNGNAAAAALGSTDANANFSN